MKFLSILLAAFLIAPSAFATACPEFADSITALEQAVDPQTQKDLEAASFPATFKNIEEVNRWAQGSTFGGGRMEQAELGGKKLALMFRSYTSGIKTSDIGIYVWDDGVYRFVKGIAPIRSWVTTHVYTDRVVFTPESGTQELLVLKPEELKL
jgi:hypothetical protein